MLLPIVHISMASLLAGPFAPPSGQEGSEAVPRESSAIVSWADAVQSIEYGASVDGAFRTPEKALGPAVGDTMDIVSLGRGGAIVLHFPEGIANGEGWDFAVFENAFDDFFLELGWVGVSNNGRDFVEFPVRSLTAQMVPAFGQLDATDINGFAGKYRSGYGTPFDLEALPANHGLDLAHIRYVRIRDVVGDGSQLDSEGNPIYDPYPTSTSAGFDLDAIGVRQEAFLDGLQRVNGNPWSLSKVYGWYMAQQAPWVYLQEFGWWYLAAGNADGFWAYSIDKGWLFTDKENFPLVYLADSGWARL